MPLLLGQASVRQGLFTDRWEGQPETRRRSGSETKTSTAAAPAPHTAHSPGSNLARHRHSPSVPKPLKRQKP